MPKVSMVVPVYNTAAYLNRCMQSILAQSFTDFEVILVDDGSSDESPALCDGYAAADDRVKVIHQKNGGLSNARNNGTACAGAGLITYVDSDDYIEPYYLEYMIRALEETGAQCVCARSDRVEENKLRHIDAPEFKCETWSRKEVLSGILTSEKTTVSSWNKLAPKEWYVREPFLEGRLYEDLSNTHRVLMQTEKAAFVDAVLYHYAMNAGSITGRKTTTKKQCQDYYEAVMMCAGDITRVYPELKKDSLVLTARDFMSLYLNTCRCREQDGDVEMIREQVLKWFKGNGFAAAGNRKAPVEVRMRIFLMSISPRLYKWAFYKGIKYKGKALG